MHTVNGINRVLQVIDIMKEDVNKTVIRRINLGTIFKCKYSTNLIYVQLYQRIGHRKLVIH